MDAETKQHFVTKFTALMKVRGMTLNQLCKAARISYKTGKNLLNPEFLGTSLSTINAVSMVFCNSAIHKETKPIVIDTKH